MSAAHPEGLTLGLMLYCHSLGLLHFEHGAPIFLLLWVLHIGFLVLPTKSDPVLGPENAELKGEMPTLGGPSTAECQGRGKPSPARTPQPTTTNHPLSQDARHRAALAAESS